MIWSSGVWNGRSRRALIQNIVRQDLKDGERAAALAPLKETTGWPFKLIASRMGMSVNRVVALSSIARHDAVREAVDEGRITQKQGILLGQGVKDAELSDELVDFVGGLDPVSTRAVEETARELPTDLPASTARAQTAVERLVPLGVAVVGSTPRAATSSLSSRRNGRRMGILSMDEIAIASTPLGRVLKRRTAFRDELGEILQATCEQLDIWPTHPII